MFCFSALLLSFLSFCLSRMHHFGRDVTAVHLVSGSAPWLRLLVRCFWSVMNAFNECYFAIGLLSIWLLDFSAWFAVCALFLCLMVHVSIYRLAICHVCTASCFFALSSDVS